MDTNIQTNCETFQIRVMTYNVHSCVGRDNRSDPDRIAAVIAASKPDIVALQELDVNQTRTRLDDQPYLIAKTLEMKYHFHPSFEIEDGHYGNAVLSRFHLKLVKAGPLPTVQKGQVTILKRTARNSFREPRGALWVEADLGDRKLQFITTHFGLNRRERFLQAEALMGPDWIQHPDCRGPVILCGDFNARAASKECRLIRAKMKDAQEFPGIDKTGPTFMSHFPFIRIDHIFLSAGLTAVHVEAPKTTLTKTASDHLPLIADITLGTFS